MENRAAKSVTTTAIVLSIVFLLAVFGFFAFVFFSNPNEKVNYKIYGGMTDELTDSDLFEDLQSGRSICFLGDSITAGTEINGVHWYDPMAPYIKGDISNLSTGGWMVQDLIDQTANIPKADIYIIAIGINDVLFNNTVKSSKTPAEFARRASVLTESINGISPSAKIYFIAPWTFISEKEELNESGIQYRSALKDLCAEKGFKYIDPNPVIVSVLDAEGTDKFMFNSFHPNAKEGVGLFSYAVLKTAHESRV
ncbi:lysophospholipase L1-like esterase [Ruminococcaceae bacterium R-25]|nr:lysophospholipase L1-like esterase [Ruminococcaceae bacterium R-25]SUQ10922.1 Lysophospholipase L1 [Oscillospiraceae bacterium]